MAFSGGSDETIRIAFEGVLDDSEIRNLVNAVGTGFTQGTVKGATEGAKKAQKIWTDLVAAGTNAGLEGGILRSGKKMEKIGGKIFDANVIARQLQIAYELNDAAEIARLERRAKLETEKFQDIADRRDSHMKEFTRLQKREFHEVADDFGNSLQGTLGSLGSGDFGGLIKGLGKKARMEGDVSAKKGSAADATKMQKVMGKVGKTMAVMGTAMMGIGAAVGVVVLLVKMFIDLDSKIKAMNKSIAETAGAADFGFRGGALKAGYEIEKQIINMRDSIIEAAGPNGMDGFRQSSEDMFKVLSTMNEANYTFKQMQFEIDHTGSEMENFVDVTNTAIAYSKLLGIDMQTAAGDMAKLANEWGTNLQTISEGFSVIHREAMLSGFSVKRFYSTILEVTSGMGQYNVRVEEAAAMLKTLGNVLGETVGADFLKSISTGFKDASQQQRMGEVIKRGGPSSKAMKSLFADVASANSDALFRDLSRSKGAMATLEKQGVDTSSAEGFAKSMSKVSPKEKMKMMGSLQTQGVEGELVGRFSDLTDQFMAANGNFAAMTEAMAHMGPAATLAMLRKPGGPFGGKSISEAMNEAMASGDPTVKAALEELTGLSGPAFDDLLAADERMTSQFGAAQDAAQRIAKGTLKNDEAVQMAMAEKFGVAVDAQTGKLTAATLDPDTGELIFGKPVKDVGEYILAQNDLTGDQIEQVAEDIELARKIAHATEGFENVLKENINAILIKIYERITDIWDELVTFFGGQGPENEIQRKAAIVRLGASEAAAETQAMDMRSKLDELMKQMDGADEETKKDLEKQIVVYQDGLKQLEQQGIDSRKLRAELGKSEYEGKYTNIAEYLRAAKEATGLEGGANVSGASTYDINKEFYQKFEEGGFYADRMADWAGSGKYQEAGSEEGKEMSGREVLSEAILISGAKSEFLKKYGIQGAEDKEKEIYTKALGAMTGSDEVQRRAQFLEEAKRGLGAALHEAGSARITSGVDDVVEDVEAKAAELAKEMADRQAVKKVADDAKATKREEGMAAVEDRPINVNLTVINKDGSVDASAEVDASKASTENEQATSSP